MSTHLVPTGATLPARQETPQERLQAEYEKLQQKDLDVVRGMNRFAELPSMLEGEAFKKFKALLANGTDDEIKAAGWKNRKQLRMAFYGTLPKKSWPASMQAAHERVLARTRKVGKEKGGNVFNLNMITIPAPKPPDDNTKVVVIDVKESG